MWLCMFTFCSIFGVLLVWPFHCHSLARHALNCFFLAFCRILPWHTHILLSAYITVCFCHTYFGLRAEIARLFAKRFCFSFLLYSTDSMLAACSLLCALCLLFICGCALVSKKIPFECFRSFVFIILSIVCLLFFHLYASYGKG